MAEIVAVMKLPVHNRIVRVHKYDDDARGDADDTHLHTNSDDEGADTIRHKHNDDDDGNFTTTTTTTTTTKRKTTTTTRMTPGTTTTATSTTATTTTISPRNHRDSNVYVVHKTILISMASATTHEKHEFVIVLRVMFLCTGP